MDAEFLAKIIRFVKEKQEKFIIVEPDGAEAVVIMPFSDYEKRLDGDGSARLTGQSDSDRIDRDIVVKSSEQSAETSSLPKTSDDWGGNTPEDDLEESRDRFYMEPLE